MKINLKSFFAGILASTLLFTSTLVFAETSETIQAVFGRVKLMVNGTSVEEETLLYNGTTYVPLRAAANILGMEVGWDEVSNTASLNKAGYVAPTPAPVPTPAPTEAPKETAAPVATTVFYSKHPSVPDYGKTYNVSLILETTQEAENFHIYGYIDGSHKNEYFKLLTDNGFIEIKISEEQLNMTEYGISAESKIFVKGDILVMVATDTANKAFIVGVASY